jgi:hypothetical protein
LAARGFATGKEAFAFENELKKYPQRKLDWKMQCVERAHKIVGRHGYGFSVTSWARKPRKKRSAAGRGESDRLEDETTRKR